MKYYYLDGIEKKGPYTLAELKSRNLSPDTLIYKEGRQNWKRLSDFEDMKKISDNTPNEKSIKINDIKKNNPKDIKIKLPSYTILLLLMFFSLLMSGLIVYIQQKSNYDKINAEIDSLFKGKTTISDYYCGDYLDGKLYDVVYNPSETSISGINFNNASVKANGITLDFQPFKSENDKYGYWYDKEVKQWEMFKSLKQYFIKSDFRNGFDAFSLYRDSNRFSITTYFGGDMAYKVPEKIHKKGINYGYFSTPGYDIQTYRPSIVNCYKEAAEYLTKDDKDSTYVAGTYTNIFGFEFQFQNDFYEINSIGDKYIRTVDTIQVIKPNGDKTYVIDENKITSSTSRSDGNVYNSQWIVWYKSYTNQFALEPKKWAVLKYFSIYSIIGIILSVIIFFIIKNRKRIVIDK